jgi:hypothetical protein
VNFEAFIGSSPPSHRNQVPKTLTQNDPIPRVQTTTATAFCRRDLVLKIGLGAILFVVYYTVFLLGLELTSPGYIERVWTLSALSGVDVAGLPIEELLFAAGFGAYWSSVYEHFTWRGALSTNAATRYKPIN